MELQIHPLALAFPEMTDEEFEALREDIRAHGQREPITVLDGMVLEGRHRYLACRELGIEPNTLKFYGDDPVAFVISANNIRRHLTATQRAEAVVACNRWTPAGRQAGVVARVALKPGKQSAPVPNNGAEIPGTNPAIYICGSEASDESVKSALVPVLPETSKTDKELASLAGVSVRTIADTKAGHAAGLGDAMRDGVLSAKQAAQIARGDGKPKKNKPTEPTTPAAPPTPDFTVELDELREANQVLSEEVDRLTDRLAVAAMEGTEEERAAAAQTIAELRRRVAVLEAENDALKSGRDQWMHKDSEMQKEIGGLRRKVARLEKDSRVAA